jgi:DNA-binding CsgD family transcriptional regulator
VTAVIDVPPIEDMIRCAFARVDNDDVRLFYDYFDELKEHVRKHLGHKARTLPGESAVTQSALFSLLCDVTLQGIPLSDVDERGYPALWPLLLKYIERHCNKWNKYYRAEKRRRSEVPLAVGDDAEGAVNPPDHVASPADEAIFHEMLEALDAKLTPRQRRIAELTAGGHTLEQIAADLGYSEALISIEKKAIRKLLESA